jgi:nitroimidazol reductase NimA-like FMN-containing flavoprotein (pyridoxamine 5'-phosphate oxidase superfamily)
MTTPKTALDERFSDKGASATTWEQTVALLEAAELFWVTTVRADGRPHVTPLVAVWLDDALHFCTGPAEQKSLNLGANPNVVLTTGTNEWDAGTDVMVEGEAVPVTDDAVLARLAEAWTRKWDGRWVFEARDGAFRHADQEGVANVYAVRPSRVLAFGKGGFSHTSHRF